MEENQTDVLADIVTSTQLTQANGWKRFANFLIDYFIYYVLLVILIILLNVAGSSIFRDDAGSADFPILIASILVFIFYYTLLEMLTKGRTIGKLITGTKVVNEDGSNISFGTAFKRSLSRIVPFEVFSALGSPCYPWHDKWNRTYVIDIKKSSVISGVENNV